MTDNLESNQNTTTKNMESGEKSSMVGKEHQEHASQKEIKNFTAYGGFWRRFAASILDWWIYIVSLIVVYFLIFLVSLSDVESIMITIFSMILVFVANIWNVRMNIYSYFEYGETMGYKALGLSIVSRKTGLRPSSKSLLKRYETKIWFWFSSFVLMYLTFFVFIITASDLWWLAMSYILPLLLFLVFSLLISLNKEKRGLHDMFANTVVVMEKVSRTWIVWLINIFVFSTFSVLMSISVYSFIGMQNIIDQRAEENIGPVQY